ncbi:ATP-binding protein [Ramlibacter sp. AN1015]|uniref:ATP-binding protein n=1 Tax=Ramlibacter sp. AN1015 TaxID=3133428 RepID=UPI0030C51552
MNPRDLLACASEPIHLPGAIQPHGCLLVSDSAGLVCQASANSQSFLRLEHAPLGQHLRAILGAQVADRLSQGARHDADEGFQITRGTGSYWVTPHDSAPLTLIEIEPAQPQLDEHKARVALRQVATVTSHEQLLHAAADTVRALTGFDRVMAYRFDEDGHGAVVAESRDLDMDPYLGLHYPESDIPRQARALYLRTPIRCIPDAAYQPVPMEPTIRPDTQQPLDMSDVLLRSVSPVHLEYLHNMGVRASMSISLVVDGRLWGLISCAHRTAKPVSPALRAACETIGRLVSLQLGAFAATRLQRRIASGREVLASLDSTLRASEGNVLTRIFADPVNLTELVGASGAAVVLGSSDVRRYGLCPADDEIREIAAASARAAQEGIFATRQLTTLLPTAGPLAETASGVLAIHLPEKEGSLLWFRPEEVQTVNWGGDPHKSAEVDLDAAGVPRLHPRRSFAVWTQQVRGRSLPWDEGDVTLAADVRRTLLEHDLQRQVMLQTKAVRARDDLVAVVSHDLRTPVSIVAMQAAVLLRLANQDSGDRAARLLASVQVIQRSAERMTTLLRDLLDLGKIEAGRFELVPSPQTASSLVSEACELMEHLGTAKGVSIYRAQAPQLQVLADPERIFQVFANLIGNAVKFTPGGGTVTVGAQKSGSGCEFFVRDTGTGMSPEQLEHVFERYWQGRASAPSLEGAGLGLYICKGIVEAHRGRMRAESIQGSGSAFYFWLPAA